jgi:hypothetical protein
MNCANPLFLRSLEIYVPCGRCELCLQSRTRDWSHRLQFQAQGSDGSIFLTLTYRPDTLPANFSLDKRDCQLFMKRLRTYIERATFIDGIKTPYSPLTKIKYFIAGEYGPKTNRPHYHAIIFGLKNNLYTQKLIEHAWGLGHVDVQGFSPDAAYYVAGYCQKKLYGQKGVNQYGRRLPPFSLMSIKLGHRWLLANMEELKKKMTYAVKGRVYTISRWMRKKMGIEKDEFFEYCSQFFQEEINLAIASGINPYYPIPQFDNPIDECEFKYLLRQQGLIHGRVYVTVEFLKFQSFRAKLKQAEVRQKIKDWRSKLCEQTISQEMIHSILSPQLEMSV